MKILKEGKIPVKLNYIYKGNCTHCGCVIETSESETKASNGMFKCPTEHCESYIHVSGLPALPPMMDDYWRFQSSTSR